MQLFGVSPSRLSVFPPYLLLRCRIMLLFWNAADGLVEPPLGKTWDSSDRCSSYLEHLLRFSVFLFRFPLNPPVACRVFYSPLKFVFFASHGRFYVTRYCWVTGSCSFPGPGKLSMKKEKQTSSFQTFSLWWHIVPEIWNLFAWPSVTLLGLCFGISSVSKPRLVKSTCCSSAGLQDDSMAGKSRFPIEQPVIKKINFLIIGTLFFVQIFIHISDKKFFLCQENSDVCSSSGW